jgi:hypothetical protein
MAMRPERRRNGLRAVASTPAILGGRGGIDISVGP